MLASVHTILARHDRPLLAVLVERFLVAAGRERYEVQKQEASECDERSEVHLLSRGGRLLMRTSGMVLAAGRRCG